MSAADPRKATLLFPKPALAARGGAPVPAPSEPAAIPEPPKAKRKRVKAEDIDWEAIYPDFRTGMSLRLLQRKHGVHYKAIQRHADEHLWVKDLTEAINARTASLVSQELVTTQVTTASRVTETQTIEAVAQAQVRVLNEHRRDIGRARGLYLRLMGRLEDEVTVDGMTTVELAAAAALTLEERDRMEGPSGGVEVSNQQAWESVLERIGDASFRPNKAGRDPVNELYHQIISTPGRIKAMKEASEVLKNLVALEREAYRIEKMPDDTGSGGRTSLPVRFVEPVQRQIEHGPGEVE